MLNKLDWIIQGIIKFVEDWVCISKDFSQHIENSRKLLKKIKRAGITVKFKKIQFCHEVIEFLGSIFTTKGIRPDPEKIKLINNRTSTYQKVYWVDSPL